MDEVVPVKKPEHKVFDKCPVCGSKERDGDQEIKYLKAVGKLHADSFPLGIGQGIPLHDQDPRHKAPKPLIITNNTTIIPLALYVFDTCADCGTYYRTHFTCEEQVVPVQPSPIRNQAGINPFKQR
jgi:hypothetical protein